MSTSTRKIVAGLLSFAMVLTLVVGLSTSTASAAYTRSLTVGSRGADVTELQTMLAAQGYFTVAPTGYFGTITQRAVAAWQAASGITPAAGYFGPISRAYLANGTTGSTGGTSTVPGCPAGAVFNFMTGQPCSNGGSTTVGSVEGTLEVSLAGTPSNDSNVTSSTDVKVLGINARATLGAVRIDRADLKVSVTVSGAENPGNFINTIKAWDGSTLLKTWSVGSSDFIKDSSGNYYVRLSDIGLTVPKDTQKNLVFSVNTNAGIDSNRTVVVGGYGSNSLRVTSGNNVISYYDISSLSRTFTFKKPGTGTLVLQADASNPVSQNYKVDSSNGTGEVTMQAFALKASTGDVKATSIVVTGTSTGVLPSTYYLYEGSTLIDSRSPTTSGSTTAVTFNLSSSNYISVAKDQTKSFTVKASFPNNTVSATVASTTVQSVAYENANGSSAVAAGPITGNNHNFYGSAPVLTFVSSSYAKNTNTSGNTTDATGVITFKIKPVGGSMTLPTASAFTVTLASSTSETTVTGKDLVITAPNGSEITSGTLAEDTEYTAKLTVTTSSFSAGSAIVRFKVTSFGTWTVGSTSGTTSTGLDAFRTESFSTKG